MNNIKKTYNGYTNHETMLVSLWLNNDPIMYSLLTDIMEREPECLERADQLMWELKAQMYDLNLEASMWSDLLYSALDKVKWLEIVCEE